MYIFENTQLLVCKALVEWLKHKNDTPYYRNQLFTFDQLINVIYRYNKKGIVTSVPHTSVDGVQQILYHFLQSHQVDELIIGRRGQEVKLRGRRFWRGYLQQGLLQLFTQGKFSCCLATGWRIIHADHRQASAS